MSPNALRGSLSGIDSECFPSPNPSVDVFPRILIGSPQITIDHVRSSFDSFVNHLCVLLHGETPVKLKSLRLSLSKTFCFLLLILSCAERIFCSSGFRIAPAGSCCPCWTSGTGWLQLSSVLCSPALLFSCLLLALLFCLLLALLFCLLLALLFCLLLALLFCLLLALLFCLLLALLFCLLLALLFCLLLALLFSVLFILSPLLDDASASSFSTSLSPTLRIQLFDVLLAVLVPGLLYFILLLTTCSLAVAPSLILSPLALSLILSRDTLW